MQVILSLALGESPASSIAETSIPNVPDAISTVVKW